MNSFYHEDNDEDFHLTTLKDSDELLQSAKLFVPKKARKFIQHPKG